MAKIGELCCLSLFCMSLISASIASTDFETSHILSRNHHKIRKAEIGVFELKRKNITVKVTNYGAIVISVFLPDKYGKMADVALGYDTPEDYVKDSTYFGAIVGRVANRIGGAQYTYKGVTHKLVANEGKNVLHGGPKGYNRVIWKVDQYSPNAPSPSVTFSYFSFDGEEGFPGNLKVKVTYQIVQGNHLSVTMTAKALDKATPVNLAQHSYWNLGGHNSGNILAHDVQIFASKITPVDNQFIPTGKFEKVKGTPFDFLQSHPVGSKIDELPGGYDINYMLDFYKNHGPMTRVALVKEKKSGRMMELWANKPGVQFYTSNTLNVTGKGGFVYRAHAALCLETQGFPDSVNHLNFPSVMVAPGETYAHQMFYKFWATR